MSQLAFITTFDLSNAKNRFNYYLYSELKIIFMDKNCGRWPLDLLKMTRFLANTGDISESTYE